MRAKRFTLLGLLALLAANFARAETLAGIVAVNNFQGVQVLLHKRVSDKNN